MKQRVLILGVSRYQLDNGTKGGKISYTTLSRSLTDNKKEISVVSSPIDFQLFDVVSSVPLVADLDLEFRSVRSNGRDIASLGVTDIYPVADASFKSDVAEIKILGDKKPA